LLLLKYWIQLRISTMLPLLLLPLLWLLGMNWGCSSSRTLPTTAALPEQVCDSKHQA
jgi:hypothetical protein